MSDSPEREARQAAEEADRAAQDAQRAAEEAVRAARRAEDAASRSLGEAVSEGVDGNLPPPSAVSPDPVPPPAAPTGTG